MTKGELTTVFGGGKVAIGGDKEALADALSHDVQETGDGQGGGDKLFLNFSGKSGRYSLGKNREAVDPEECFAMMPESSSRGWVFWRASKPIKRHRWAVGQQGIAEEDLEDLDAPKQADGWQSERAFLCKSLESGKMIEFSTTSVSGCNSVADLLVAVTERIKSGKEDFYPIINFSEEQFTAHEQTNWKPTFPIVGWATMDELVKYEAEELELDDLLIGDEDKPEPVESKAKKKAAPKRRRAAL